MTVKGKTKLSLVAMLLVLALSLAFSIAPAAATGCCECNCGPCTGTPGYWKNHPDAWPVEEITVGGVTYTKAEAIALLDGPVKGDKSVTMFKAVVAAMLNDYNECCAGCIRCKINQANEWLEDNPLNSGVKANSDAWQCEGEALYWALDDYNNGRLECADARE